MSDTRNNVMGTVIKLAVVCLIVGYVIHFFELTPEKVLENFGETVAALYGAALDFGEWASDYFITGALVVLPIWGLATLLSYLKNRFDGKKR